LPLARGSRLVVDAGERAVAAGQTNPKELLTLVHRGVDVYGIPNLHAKVFVLGRAAYVGSANVSKHSAETAIEAMVRASDPRLVGDARDFVRRHCLYQLTPAVLKRLAKMHHPPLGPRQTRSKRRVKKTPIAPTLPRLLLAHLDRQTLTQSEEALHKAGLLPAQKARKHPRSYVMESFL
jgi:phosphatidylserine/phosphatidylglycerophosphate/cardiolipin synthase-like enzyme